MSCSIHQTAIVDSKAELGADVEIGPYAIIGPHVKLGDRCRVQSHAVIDGHTTIGEDTIIFPFAAVGNAPQDLKFKGEASTLIIGKRNQVREYVTLHPGTAHSTMTTVIGDGNLFMVGSHVAHDCVVGSNNVFANHVSLAGHVTIGNRVVLGGMAGIHQFVRVGDLAMIGAGAMVPKDVPPYCLAQGDRAHLRGINTIGLKRAGVTAEDITKIRRLYGDLFLASGSVKRKLADIAPEMMERAVTRAMIEFLQHSNRGVCSAVRGQSNGASSEDSSSED